MTNTLESLWLMVEYFLFLDFEKVLSVKEITFLHGGAPRSKVLETQKLLQKNLIKFLSSNEFPGSFSDLTLVADSN